MTLSPEQIRQVQQIIEDRYGFIAAQLQSVEYQPPADLLYRWQQMGLVSHTVTPETFMGTVATDMHFVRNAFLMGRFIEAVESGNSFVEVMQLALHSPLLKPDLHAIQIAEQQTAMYLQDNAKDLATKAGQLAIQKRNEQIRQMAIDFHDRKLKRTVLDEDKKEQYNKEHGYEGWEEGAYKTGKRPAETWQQFSSELHHTMEDKARDWDRVAYTELVTAQETGKAYKILEDHGSDALVYKRTLPTACPQCVHAYCEEDGVTPKVFKLSDLLANGDNFNRKPHPTRAGKVVEGGRPDGAETMKPVSGTMHPFCACRIYKFTGYEHWHRKTDGNTN